MRKPFTLFVLLLLSALSQVNAQQHSVARQWNEILLKSVRKDLARPTVTARNLFHVSVAMYDAWAAYDSVAKPYLLGDTVGGYYTPFSGVPAPANLKAARNEAISYAAYRVIKWRYRNSPGAAITQPLVDSLFLTLGYDSSYHGINYMAGTPADLGNYIAEQVIAYGLQDGANEGGSPAYANQYYTPANPTLIPVVYGNPNVIDPNRWQPLTLSVYIDQNGNVIPITTPPALTPEWGNVTPFALTAAEKTVYTRGGNNFNVYHDPGPPPYIDTLQGLNDIYKWNHTLVGIWSSQLDPGDSVMIDISPNHIGAAHDYPTTFQQYQAFYNLYNGGDNGTGYNVNPKTNQPYTPQIVPRGDYTRVLAEFWADGPTSETPPGHWYTILNYVDDHPAFQRRWEGKGPIMDTLEWDVKSYFVLGGAVHDAAITAWGMKGWYDSARPITALRYMAQQGQSSDTSLANYSPHGLPLIPGYIEVIDSADPLAADTLGPYQHVGQIKMKAWKGNNLIPAIPATQFAGVGWILAGHWWAYQRPSFVTPPFPGYISGHSTYSRSAAEVMKLLTGDEYFPGGMGEFHATANQYLVFEDGPSVDVDLQWAKYTDASDQCSLSRIWGGIHPPADDIPGRLIGQVIGPEAYHHAVTYFDSEKPTLVVTPQVHVVSDAVAVNGSFTLTLQYNEIMDTTVIPAVTFPIENPFVNTLTFNAANSGWTNYTTYVAAYSVVDANEILNDIDVRVTGAQDLVGNTQEQFDAADNFSINTENPTLTVIPQVTLITDALTWAGTFTLTLEYSENMDTAVAPAVTFPTEDPLAHTLTFNVDTSGWINLTTYVAIYDVADANETLANVDVHITGAQFIVGNTQQPLDEADLFSIDTKNPEVVSVTPSVGTITHADVGIAAFTLAVVFDESMDTSVKFAVTFPADSINTLTYNANASAWANLTTYAAKYDVANVNEILSDVDVEVSTACADLAGNIQLPFDEASKFNIDMSTGIAGVDENFIRVYPNPVTNDATLNVSFAKLEKGATLQLMNAQGRSVYAEIVKDTNTHIALASLPAGLYLLRVSGAQNEQSFRVLIMNR